MTEPSMRTDLVDREATGTAYFKWEVAHKPLSIQIRRDLMASLDAQANESFRSRSARGSEIGGLLLGRIGREVQPVVVVEGIEPIPCDYGRGPLYRLSERERERLEFAMRERRSGGGGSLAVVGFYRSNTRKDLSLDADDIALIHQYFKDPLNVYLLVKPFATKASVGGFFIWENGAIQPESSPLEFPFCAMEDPIRALERRPRPSIEKPVAPGELPAAGQENGSVSKPPVRAQVVPIASRREGSGVFPEEKEHAAAPSTPTVPERPPAELREQVVPEIPARRSRSILIYSGLLSAAVLSVVVFYARSHRSPAPQPPPVENREQTEHVSLGLRVERSAGQLLLTWNRDSESVRTATRARLAISDGSQHEDVELDMPQLRNGSVVYSPISTDVNFRLEVASADPANSRQEYVRFIGRPSAMPQTPGPAPTGLPPDPGTANPLPSGIEAKPAAPQNFSAASLAGRLRPATADELMEPPALPVSGAQQLAGIPASLNQAPKPPVVVAPGTPASSSAQTSPDPAAVRPGSGPAAVQPKVGGVLKEARLLFRKDPVYPSFAKQARVHGVVRLEALLGKDGRVKSVTVISGPPLLRQAASDALKTWVYSPALLNNEPIETTTRVDVNFDGQGK